MATLITKAKQIIIAAWEDNAETYPTSGEQLDYVIADTLSVNQDDAEEQTFEFETSDQGETFYTDGDINVDLQNAELSKEFMTKIMGWVETTTPKGFVAPEQHIQKYVALQVKFADDVYFFLPKIAVAPKLVMESVKTNLVYGTISGKATMGTIGTGASAKKTAIGRFETAILTKATTTEPGS